MKRKKKNALKLISLLIVLAALIGAYFWYSNWKKTSADKSATEGQSSETIELGTIDKSQLSSLHYTGKDVDLTLKLEDGVWKSEADPQRPINQTNVQGLIGIIGDVKADRLVTETPEDLSEYGLNDPTASLEATQTDGKIISIKIGDEAIGGTGYYALVNNDNKVYLLGTSYGSGLKYTDNDMTDIEQGPTITAENIRHIIVDNRDKEDFEILFDRENKLDNSGSNMFPWIMLKPYEESYSVDSSKVNNVLPNYSSFNILSCVDYDSKDLSAYGLDNPLASVYVQYYETRTETLPTPETDPTTGEQTTEKTYEDNYDYKIYIGNTDEEGNYYVKKDGSNAVYTMSADVINKMLEVNTFDLVSKFVNIPNIENVDKVTAEIDGVTYDMEIKHSVTKDADGKDTTTATYYHNGKEVTKEEFQPIYQSMISAKYDSPINEDVTADGLKPVLTITYHVNKDKDVTLSESFLPYNDSFYLVDAGSKIRFFADKRAIDDVVKSIKDFKVPEAQN